MSDKKIQIQIATAGGEQAAAQVKKVKEAVVAQAGSINALEKEVMEATKAYKAAVAGTDEFVAASKRLEVAKASLNDATKKVTASGLSMKGSLQNVGYQVQDLAVQIGSGTSAFTAFGQQAPQLLSGFGPVGILLGTISAVALPLAGAMFKLGDETEGAGKKADATADKLQNLREKAANLAAEKSEKKLNAWLDSLDDEEEAIRLQNDALQRNIELMRQKRRSEAETADLERELEIANIETDPNRSEEQKIIEVARVRQKSDRAAADEKKKDLADQADSSALKSIADWEASLREEADLYKVKARKKALEEEKQDLMKRQNEANAGAARVPAIDKELKSLAQELNRASQGAGQVGLSQSQLLEFQNRRETLEKERDEAEIKKGSIDNKGRDRLKNPKGEGDVETEIKSLDDKISEQMKKLDAAKLAAAESAAKAAEAKSVRDSQTPQIEKRFEINTRINDARATAAVREAKERAEKKAEEEANRKKKQDLEDELDSGKDGLDASARTAGKSLLKSVRRGPSVVVRNGKTRIVKNAPKQSSGGVTAEKIGKMLSDGTDSAELQKIGDLINEKQGDLGERTVTILKGVVDKLVEQSAKMGTMQEQIRNIGRRSR